MLPQRLNYELEQYMTALERFPRVGVKVTIRSSGQGARTRVRVRKIDIFRDKLRVESEESGERMEIRLDEVDLPARDS